MASNRKTSADLMDVPVVQKQLKRAGKYMAEKRCVKFIESIDRVGRVLDLKLESPLEAIFWLWWESCSELDIDMFPYELIHLERQVDVIANGRPYRLDFVVSLNTSWPWQRAFDADILRWPRIAVEVDGHEFHERTTEQVQRRDSRDRALQMDGWQVFHFSWSELTSHPENCVEQVYHFATTTAVELYRRFELEIPPEFKSAPAAE